MQVRTVVSKEKVPVYGMKSTRLRDNFRGKVPSYGIGYQKIFDEKEPLRKYRDIVSLWLMKNLAETDLNRKEVRKHVGAIQINGKLSLLQRKLANVLLWNAYDELQKEERHRIRIRDLAYLVGFDSNDLQVLKNALRGLAETPLEWNVLHEDGDEEWGVASMVGQAVIRGGYCSYSYSPDLRDKFHNPEMYARINIGIQRNITTGYALTLYENCIRYRNVGSTGWIALEDARTLFGVNDKKYYRMFKFFNNKIIKPAIEGINTTSDILVSVHYRREKRCVSAVKFTIKENPQISLFRKKGAASEPVGELSPPAQEAKAGGQKELWDRLMSYGMSKSSADRYLYEHPDNYIRENLDIVEKNYQAGKVANLPAYTVAALETDYRPKVSPYETALAEKKSTRKRLAVEETKRKEQEEREQNEREAAELRRRIESLPDKERKTFEARFQKAHETHPLFLKWKDGGMSHPVIKGLFLAFAYRELMPDASKAPDPKEVITVKAA